jgi:hypothetical protein
LHSGTQLNKLQGEGSYNLFHLQVATYIHNQIGPIYIGLSPNRCRQIKLQVNP